jgi:glutamyl-tRNA synthetase
VLAIPKNPISRIAPTPSGYLHLGNVFNFLLTWYLVRKCNGILHLRIDDIDSLRTKPEYLNDIFETLNWLDLDYDFGPKNTQEHVNYFSQKLHMGRYKEVLNSLIHKNLVYACNCSRSKLKLELKDVSTCNCTIKNLALNTPNCSIKLRSLTSDIVCLNKQNIKVENAQNFIVWRKDDLPAYQLTSVTYDMDNRINLIVRGSDLMQSTCMQLQLAEVLEWKTFKDTYFIHHPLIYNNNGSKLSKSAGAMSIMKMRKNGTSAAEIYNAFAKWLQLPNTNIYNKNALIQESISDVLRVVHQFYSSKRK